MKIVIGLGGSILTKEITYENFKKYADVLVKLKEKGHRVVVICGGGKTCREYQKIAKQSNATATLTDRIGIIATRLNALTLISVLGSMPFKMLLKVWKS
ncbi:MAG: hypothetical protein QXQ69_03010 [Candidatus Aenigmatarchaeota archaeon]